MASTSRSHAGTSPVLPRVERAEIDLSVLSHSSLAAAVVTASPSAKLLHINPAWASLTGLSRQHLMGHGLADLFAPGADRAVQAVLQRADEGAEPSALTPAAEWLLLRAALPERWVSVSALPLPAATARDCRLVLMFDATAAREEREALARAALNDPLTGIPNRALFYDRLHLALAAEARQNRYLTVLFLDLDHFKAINDTHGHGTGDAVLRECASRISACLRGEDTVARLGGDEFAIVCPGLSPRDVDVVVARLQRAFATPFVGATAAPLDVAVSIGHSSVHGAGHTAAALMKAADTAMYRHKQGTAARTGDNGSQAASAT